MPCCFSLLCLLLLCLHLIMCGSVEAATEEGENATAGKDAQASKQTAPEIQRTAPDSKEAARNVKITSLNGEAIVLQEEAAKIDKVVKDFASHGQAYQDSSLHKNVLQGGISKSAAAGGENGGLPGHAKNVHDLHSEYAAHVAQLKAMVDQYRHFYQAYAAHYQQYKGHLDEFSLQAQQAKSA